MFLGSSLASTLSTKRSISAHRASLSPKPQDVIVAVKLDEACALDVLGDVAPCLRRADRVAAAVQDQRRHLDLAQERAGIDREVHVIELGRRRRARPRALVRRPAPRELLVAAGREAGGERKLTPHPGDLGAE
jgi:hypothetical protein